ncbi:GH92 family glycosyl hydrolase [Capnocytophaga catalasegens]|nr:GH92 family glycosyl hydrolase [Capnocytophaga catalasegens]
MRKILFIFGIVSTLLSCKQEFGETENMRLTQYVNPFIGTDGTGNTYPGATTPFGMVQLSPDIGIAGWDRISGYFYQDSIISGFSHLHLSGTGAGDLYDILIMPTNSRFKKRISANNYIPYSIFNHQNEIASPGYYSVDLQSFQIKAELTATPRVGIHRYTFPADEKTKISVDLGYAINWDKPTETCINVVDSTTIEGYRHSTGWAKDQKVFFVIKLSKPFVSYQLFDQDSLASTYYAHSKDTRIVLNYKTNENEQIVLKTAISSTSIEGAYQNMQAEAQGFDFDLFKIRANDMWEQELQKVQIKTMNENEKTIFYTMLYQSMIVPNLLSDVDGFYKGADGSVQRIDTYNRYDTFSLWDTFRAAHPLYTILQPEKTAHFIASFLAHYKETGLLPVWSMQGNETNMMIGYHAIPVIVDAYFKGIPMDKDLAYRACKESAMEDGREINLYKNYGYIPYELDSSGENWSVSKALEYAYDDWCIAMFAKDLGKNEDYEYFLKRSENWRYLFDQETKFFRPKNAKNQFIKNFNPKEYTKYFCESNAWQYRWAVPQNIPALVEVMGGEDAFEIKLDSMFNFASTVDEKLPIFSTGMIGQYVHGNEPSHHVAYLYNYTKRPSKTQERVWEILHTQYKNTPDGHCGNEDCGQMSSWYILSAMGIYPVNPAQGTFMLGIPAFKEITLQLENGNTFVVKARNLSHSNRYIKDLYLNNQPLDRLYITYDEIMKGGKLTFDMTDKPQDERLSKYKTPDPYFVK